MLCIRVILFTIFIGINFEISTIRAEESLVEILKKKVVALDDSLTMDIRLLRKDIKKNSEEFNRLSVLLDETLAKMNEGVIHESRLENLAFGSQQSDMIQKFDSVNRRLKRAFSEEKANLRNFTAKITFEIENVSNAINQELTDFKLNHKQMQNDSMEKLNSFQIDLTHDLNRIVANLANNLTDSVQSMSRDLIKGTNHAVSVMGNNSKSMELVPEMKSSVDVISRNMLESPYATAEQFDRIQEKVEQFDDRFDKINQILGQLQMNMNVYVNDKARLVNISQTSTTIEGRLEVRHYFIWGTVCDDDFTLNGLTVARKMLGFRHCTTFNGLAYYGRGDGKIWLDNVVCTGDEETLFDCSHNGIGKHNCEHGEDLGVRCLK